jgi:predicted nucleic acid-binding protein
VVTIDSNVAVYALGADERKKRIAADVIARTDFISVQVLNEVASVASRKQRRAWDEIEGRLADLSSTIGRVLPIDMPANIEAVRLAARYQLAFYDALMLAVALSGGARTIYSEDMQDNLVIDDTLRIVDPFR